MLVSAVWLVTCIPIITAGAALCALNKTVRNNLRLDRGYLLATYFKSFKSCFKQATIVWSAILALVLIILADYRACFVFSEKIPLLYTLRFIFIGMLFVLLAFCLYVFPYISRFELDTKSIVQNCVFLMFRHLPLSILMVLIVTGGAALLYFLPVLMIVLPAMCMVLISIIEERIFRKYMTKEQLQQEYAEERFE